MKGKILDFSINTSEGVISGDDGNRYTFTGKDWKSSEPPRAGARVDFENEGDNAIGVYIDIQANLPGTAGKVVNDAIAGIRDKASSQWSEIQRRPFRLGWKSLDMGGKIIVVAACIAIASMFMNWLDAIILTRTGISRGTVFFLAFWIYPVLMVSKGMPIIRSWGLTCVIASLLAVLAYIWHHTIPGPGRETMIIAGDGSWMYLLATIALCVGVVKYEATPIQEDLRAT